MPSLNEEESIGKTIDSIPMKELEADGYAVEVLIVDGGSTDRTVAIALDKGARIISSAPGYGLQHRAGFANATGEIIITADSDYSYPLENVIPLLHILEDKKLDFITANRFAVMEKNAMKLLNKIGNKFLTFATNILFNMKLKDSQSGMWIIRKTALPKLDLTSDGMTFSQEIKIEAFYKLKAMEVDFRFRHRIGEVKLKRFEDGFKNLIHLIRKRSIMLR